MNIALISDSHNNLENIKKAVEIANSQNCKYLLHLGDIVSPVSAALLGDFKGIVYGVFGNMDGEHQGLKSTFNRFGGIISRAPLKIDINGKRIVLLHEPYQMEELAGSEEFDYLFYGHLHKVDFRKIKNTIIMNPGELCGRSSAPTFFILNLDTAEYSKIEL